jgi:hypothetical protein
LGAKGAVLDEVDYWGWRLVCELWGVMEGEIRAFVFGFDGVDDDCPQFGCFAAEDDGDGVRHDAFWDSCQGLCRNAIVEFGNSLKVKRLRRESRRLAVFK